MPGHERNLGARQSSPRPSAPAWDRRRRRRPRSASFLPSTPPAALMSATACSAPFFICRPNADSAPVIGPATAMVMSCANALADSANVAPSARPKSFSDFMRRPSWSSLSSGRTRQAPGPEITAALSADFAVKSPAIFRQIDAGMPQHLLHGGRRASVRGGRLPDRRRGFPAAAATRCRFRSGVIRPLTMT